MDINTDVLIIGAGPAGTSAASLLNQAGLKVCIAEKEKFPRFVIGESLLPHSMDLLEEAALLAPIQAQNYMVKHGAFFAKGEIAFDVNFAEQFSPGWKYTYQVPRADFDKVLADTVQNKGVQILYQHTVTEVSVSHEDSWAQLKNAQGESLKINSRFILDASGYGRVLPRLLNLDKPTDFPHRMALFSHVTGDKRPAGMDEGKIWVCVVDEGMWIWMIPFSNGKTSIGVVGENKMFEKFPTDPEERLRSIIALDPRLKERFSNYQLTFPPRIIEGYASSVKCFSGPGFALLGNATEFLDPIFSSGVTLALESANRAAKLLIKQFAGEKIDWLKDFEVYMLKGVNVFKTYVKAWYDGTLPSIFFSPKVDDKIKKQICSVLAGYVWDDANPLVQKHARAINVLAELVSSKI